MAYVMDYVNVTVTDVEDEQTFDEERNYVDEPQEDVML